MYGSYAMLIISAVYLMVHMRSLIGVGVVLLLSWLPSFVAEGSEKDLLLRVGAICLLLFVLGPVIDSKISRQYRTSAWLYVGLLTVFIGLMSAFWYVFRLPGYWRGSFTGVMTYAMLVGPFSAMGAMFAILRAIRSKSLIWVAVSLACLIPCLASGSRLAVVCFAGALVVTLILMRREMKFFIPAISIASLALIVSTLFTVGQPSQESEMIKHLREKGLSNSREELWSARIKEFKSSPWVGIGIGKAEGGGSSENEQGGGTVEPGSSYLAILSMTGVIGASAYIALLLSILCKWRKCWKQVALWKHAELAAYGVFFAIHAIGEGWILAVGSPLCFVYWLWLGHIYDYVNKRGSSHKTLRRKSSKSRGKRSHGDELGKPIGSID